MLYTPKVWFSSCCLGPESACCSWNITLLWMLTVSGPSCDFPELTTLFCKEKYIYECLLGRMKSTLAWRFEMFWIVQACLLLTLALLSHPSLLDTACWDRILLHIPFRKSWSLNSFLYLLLAENWASGLLLQSNFEDKKGQRLTTLSTSILERGYLPWKKKSLLIQSLASSSTFNTLAISQIYTNPEIQFK